MVRAPSIIEYERLIDYLRDSAMRDSKLDYVLPLFIGVTGARASETVRIMIYKIDFDTGLVAIPTAKHKWEPRHVPLPSWSMPIIRQYIVRNAITDRLFPISRQMVWYRVKKVTGWHPHALRHAFAMYALYKGIDPETVKRWLGHKTWKMVEYYVRIVGGTEGIKNPWDI